METAENGNVKHTPPPQISSLLRESLSCTSPLATAIVTNEPGHFTPTVHHHKASLSKKSGFMGKCRTHTLLDEVLMALLLFLLGP